MTARRMRYPGASAWMTCLCLLLLGATAQAQDPLARARDLYLSAAYDEALVVLEQLKTQPPPVPVTEVEQYRMFCLLALERSDEARKAIENLVSADPAYRPSAAQTSPRIRAVFQDTRKEVMPALVQRKYAEAKASFERKDPQALAQFEQILTLLDDPDVAQLSDLRTVVSGFRDLSKAMASASTAVTPPTPPPLDAKELAPATPAAAVTSDIPVDFKPGFTAPAVIAQPLPRWDPPNNVDRRSSFKGLIEVTIDDQGTVTSAVLQQSVHPLYDEKLVAAARTWKYKPATINGVPTSSLKVVEIQLQPSR